MLSYLHSLNGTEYAIMEMCLATAVVIIIFWVYLYYSKRTFGAWTGPFIRYARFLTIGMYLFLVALFAVMLFKIYFYFDGITILDMNIERVFEKARVKPKLVSLVRFTILSFPFVKILCCFPLLEYNEQGRKWKNNISKTSYLVCSPFLYATLIALVGNLGIILPLLFLESLMTYMWFVYRALMKEKISRDDVHTFRWLVILIQLFCFASSMIVLIRAMTIEEEQYHWIFFGLFMSLMVMFVIFIVDMSRKHSIRSLTESKDEKEKKKKE